MNNHLLKFQTIALATDLKSDSSSALRYAQTMARMYQATLVLIYVIDPLTNAFPYSTPHLVEAAAAAELKRLEEETTAQGIAVHSVVQIGPVCEQILQTVSDYRADLLLLGAHDKSNVDRAALGTIARQLLNKSRVPIMTVSRDAADSLPWAGCWRSVLAATDFSPASVNAVQCAHQLALRQLIVVHVANSEKGHECTHCREKLRLLAPFNESHTVPVEHFLTEGNSGQAIAEYAQKFAVDLVVLGSPVDELANEALPISTIVQVVSKVNCPVLCLPQVASTGPRDRNKSETGSERPVALTGV